MSGGVDSYAVVDSMTRSLGRPVEACTVGFSDPRYDERAGARELAVQDLTSALSGSAGLTANDVPACLASLERLLTELDDKELGARTIEALTAHCDTAQLAALRAALQADG